MGIHQDPVKFAQIIGFGGVTLRSRSEVLLHG